MYIKNKFSTRLSLTSGITALSIIVSVLAMSAMPAYATTPGGTLSGHAPTEASNPSVRAYTSDTSGVKLRIRPSITTALSNTVPFPAGDVSTKEFLIYSRIFYDSNKVTPSNLEIGGETYTGTVGGNATLVQDKYIHGGGINLSPINIYAGFYQLIDTLSITTPQASSHCLFNTGMIPDSIDGTDTSSATLATVKSTIEALGYDKCVLVGVSINGVRVENGISKNLFANALTTGTNLDLGDVNFNIEDGAGGNIDFLSWVFIKQGASSWNVSPGTITSISDSKPPTITLEENLPTTTSTTDDEFKMQVSEPIALNKVTVTCTPGTTYTPGGGTNINPTLIIADSTGGAARTTAIPKGVDVFVKISAGLTGSTRYTCAATVSDGTNTSASATQLGSFIFADTTAPMFDSIAVERSSTNNADAKSNKYAKEDDTVKVTLNFNENISSVGTVVIKMGGSSGTTVTSSDPKDPSDDTTFDGSSDTTSSVYYTFDVPSGVNGAVYVSAVNFIDKASAPNTQSVAQNYTTTTADDTLASFFVIDTVAPSAPSAPDLKAGSDTGHSDIDNITSNETPIITVDLATNADSTVDRARVTATKSSETVVGNRNGDGDVTLGTLAEGTWSVEVNAIDNAGNSIASGSPLSVRIDKTAPTSPTVPLNSAAPFASSDRYINSAESSTNAATVLVGTTTGGGKHDGSDAFAITASDTACQDGLTFGESDTVEVRDVSSDGVYRVCFRAADEAGNYAYATSPTFTKDTTDPTVFIIDLTVNNYQITAADANTPTASYVLNGIASSGVTCNAGQTYTPVPGNSQITITAGNLPCVSVADAAGNTIYSTSVTQGAAITGIGVSSETAGSKLIGGSSTFNVYGTGPAESTVTLRRRSTSTTTDTLSDYATVIGSDTIASGASTWSVAVNLADDTYDFATTSVLGDGTVLNTPVPYKGVVVDTTAPTASLSATPTAASVSNATTATATVAGTGVTHYKYEIVAGASCSGATYAGSEVVVGTGISEISAISPLADGPVSLCVIGRDQAGNWQQTGTPHTWTKDTTGPSLTFVSLTSDNTGNTAFSKENHVLTALVRVTDANPAATFTPTASIDVSGLTLSAKLASRLTDGNIQIVGTLPTSLTGITNTATPSVSVTGSTVVDAAGNAATDLTHAATAHTVDDQAPTVSAVSATSNERGRTSISFTTATATAQEPLQVVLSHSCDADAGFDSKSVSGAGAQSVVYSGINAETYSDCTVKVVDPVGHESTPVSIAEFSVLRRGGSAGPVSGGGGSRAPSLSESRQGPSASASRVIGSSAGAAAAPVVLYRRGDENPQIRQIQQSLNYLGHTIAESGPGSPGSETDYFGPATERAVMSFQQANSMSATGVLDGTTVRQILIMTIIKRIEAIKLRIAELQSAEGE